MVTTLHIDTRLSRSEVRDLVTEITGGTNLHGRVHVSWGKVGIGNDLRSHPHSEPDDFLNWPYYVDTVPGATVSEEEFLKGVYALRNGLVEAGVRVWIVSDLDHVFPAGWTPDG